MPARPRAFNRVGGRAVTLSSCRTLVLAHIRYVEDREREEIAMSRAITPNVRDLMQRDKERAEAQGFEQLKTELAAAFAAPESAYEIIDAETIIARNVRR